MKHFFKTYGMYFAGAVVLAAILGGVFLLERDGALPDEPTVVLRDETQTDGESKLPPSSDVSDGAQEEDIHEPSEDSREGKDSVEAEAAVSDEPDISDASNVSDVFDESEKAEGSQTSEDTEEYEASPVPEISRKAEKNDVEGPTLLMGQESSVPDENKHADEARPDEPTVILPSGVPGTTPAAEPTSDKTETTVPATDSAPGLPEAENLITLCVRCDVLCSDASGLDPEKLELVPQNGILFEAESVAFTPGESVFDVLNREMRAQKIHMEYVASPLYGTAYIEGIGNLYEFDAGELSGWMYRVNGEFPRFGCSKYTLKSGDRVEWLYTCDLGRDIGADDGDLEAQKND